MDALILSAVPMAVGLAYAGVFCRIAYLLDGAGAARQVWVLAWRALRQLSAVGANRPLSGSGLRTVTRCRAPPMAG